MKDDETRSEILRLARFSTETGKTAHPTMKSATPHRTSLVKLSLSFRVKKKKKTDTEILRSSMRNLTPCGVITNKNLALST